MKKYLAIPAVFAIIMVSCIIYAINGTDAYDLEIIITQEQFATSNSVIQEVETGINKSLVLRLYGDPEGECSWRIADPGDEAVVLNVEQNSYTWTFLTMNKGQSEIRFVHGPPPGGGPQETYIFTLKITVE